MISVDDDDMTINLKSWIILNLFSFVLRAKSICSMEGDCGRGYMNFNSPYVYDIE